MKVYLDNNSTTRLLPEVLDAMLPYLTTYYGNASSPYAFGREARKAMEQARETIASIIGASSPDSVIFTGSGTESDNLAIQGVARALNTKGKHIITSAVEHSAVLNACKFLEEEEGFEVTFLKPDSYGVITASAVAEAIRNDTILISIMHANNETGTINPIREIAERAKKANVLFHTDAVQTFCKLPFTVNELGVDLLSLSAHKIHGPKGVGALYVRQGVPLKPMIYGGHQEEGLRPGTENVAGIVGLSKAAALSVSHLEEDARRITTLRKRLEEGLRRAISDLRLNGHPELRLPNTLNLSVPFVEAESLLLELDLKGVAVSSGSACTSGTGEPSHVLLSMGIPHEICRGALRFSLGSDTTGEEIDYVLAVLPEIVNRIQAMSPLADRKFGT